MQTDDQMTHVFDQCDSNELNFIDPVRLPPSNPCTVLILRLSQTEVALFVKIMFIGDRRDAIRVIHATVFAEAVTPIEHVSMSHDVAWKKQFDSTKVISNLVQRNSMCAI